MINVKRFRMPDRRNDEKEESLSGELDELIPRNRGPQDHENDDGGGEDEIQCENPTLSLPLTEISEHQRKESNEEKEKQGNFHGNKKKIRSKVKKILLSPIRQLSKHLKGENKEAGNRRNNSPPFPYDGEDFGGRPPSCYLCEPSLRVKTRTAATMPKPETSSYYYFSKSLIEKNDFYSSDSNVHRDIPRSQTK